MKNWLQTGSITFFFTAALAGCGGGPSNPDDAAGMVGADDGADDGVVDSGGAEVVAPTGVPFVYVGGSGNLVRIFRLNVNDGSLTPVGSPVDAGTNPTFLAVNPERTTLFAVNEASGSSAAVASFHIDPKTGALQFLSRVSSKGDGPAHVATDRKGKFAFVANYGGGTVAVLPINATGALGNAVDTHDHGGGSAHPHEVVVDPANKFAFVPNLGLDSVTSYALNETTGKLTDSGAGTLKLPGGAGPRHMDFHPTAPFAYVIDELNSTMGALSYDATKGKLTSLQTLSTLPVGFQGSNTCAEVQVSPSGKFVYGSNRGHNSIVTFSVGGDGKLSLVGHQSTLGKTPRHFQIEPSGKILLAANQDSGNIVTFFVDSTKGTLTPTGKTVNLPSPQFVGVVYLPGK